MNSITHILKIRRNENFKTISLSIYDDKRLTWKAKGLHTYLISRPENWVLNRQHILSMSTDGKYSYDAGIRELKKYGYLTLIKKGFTWIWTVFEALDMVTTERETVATTTQLPSTQFPSTRKPSIQKPVTITSSSKQEVYKQEVERESSNSLAEDNVEERQPFNYATYLVTDTDWQDEGMPTELIVKYWAQEMLSKHARKIPLTEAEIDIKSLELLNSKAPNWSNEEWKAYIDCYMSGPLSKKQYVIDKKWSWSGLLEAKVLDAYVQGQRTIQARERERVFQENLKEAKMAIPH